MANGQKSYTLSSSLRAPSLDTLAQWVCDSWNDIQTPIVVKSNKKCCISNAMDGTEDDILWKDAIQEREMTEDENEINVVLQEDDPYDNAISKSGWEELFNGKEEEDLFSRFCDKDRVCRRNAYFQYCPQPYIPRLILYLLCSQASSR